MSTWMCVSVHVLFVFEDVLSSAFCVGMWVFICFDTDLPLWPSGLKHEPTEQSLRQYAAITGASSAKDLPLTTSVWPSKHKHSWFKHWYRHIKRWMNYILHLPFRHVAGDVIQSDICFEVLLVFTGRRKAIMFCCFIIVFALIWTKQLCTQWDSRKWQFELLCV